MKIIVIADALLKSELLAQEQAGEAEAGNRTIGWATEIPAPGYGDVIIDLLFDGHQDRIKVLAELQPALIIVNSVDTTLDELPAGFIRINGWPSFLKRNTIEACCHNQELKKRVELVFGAFNKTTEWVADIPGFATARVISMIINEAYFTLEEKVSSKEEINTAMKLGTNYPYGPFEWSRLIGLKKINALLKKLSANNPRYNPCNLLEQEAAEL